MSVQQQLVAQLIQKQGYFSFADPTGSQFLKRGLKVPKAKVSGSKQKPFATPTLEAEKWVKVLETKDVGTLLEVHEFTTRFFSMKTNEFLQEAWEHVVQQYPDLPVFLVSGSAKAWYNATPFAGTKAKTTKKGIAFVKGMGLMQSYWDWHKACGDLGQEHWQLIATNLVNAISEVTGYQQQQRQRYLQDDSEDVFDEAEETDENQAPSDAEEDGSDLDTVFYDASEFVRPKAPVTPARPTPTPTARPPTLFAPVKPFVTKRRRAPQASGQASGPASSSAAASPVLPLFPELKVPEVKAPEPLLEPVPALRPVDSDKVSQCQGKTKAGKRCRHRIKGGWCSAHKNQQPVPASPAVTLPTLPTVPRVGQLPPLASYPGPASGPASSSAAALVTVPAPLTTDDSEKVSQCQGKTVKGKRCRKKAKGGWCFTHKQHKQ